MVVHRVGSEGSGSRVGCVSRAAWPGVRASRKYLLGDVTPEDYRRSLGPSLLQIESHTIDHSLQAAAIHRPTRIDHNTYALIIAISLSPTLHHGKSAKLLLGGRFGVVTVSDLSLVPPRGLFNLKSSLTSAALTRARKLALSLPPLASLAAAAAVRGDLGGVLRGDRDGTFEGLLSIAGAEAAAHILST